MFRGVMKFFGRIYKSKGARYGLYAYGLLIIFFLLDSVFRFTSMNVGGYYDLQGLNFIIPAAPLVWFAFSNGGLTMFIPFLLLGYVLNACIFVLLGFGTEKLWNAAPLIRNPVVAGLILMALALLAHSLLHYGTKEEILLRGSYPWHLFMEIPSYKLGLWTISLENKLQRLIYLNKALIALISFSAGYLLHRKLQKRV